MNVITQTCLPDASPSKSRLLGDVALDKLRRVARTFPARDLALFQMLVDTACGLEQALGLSVADVTTIDGYPANRISFGAHRCGAPRLVELSEVTQGAIGLLTQNLKVQKQKWLFGSRNHTGLPLSRRQARENLAAIFTEAGYECSCPGYMLRKLAISQHYHGHGRNQQATAQWAGMMSWSSLGDALNPNAWITKRGKNIGRSNRKTRKFRELCTEYSLESNVPELPRLDRRAKIDAIVSIANSDAETGELLAELCRRLQTGKISKRDLERLVTRR